MGALSRRFEKVKHIIAYRLYASIDWMYLGLEESSSIFLRRVAMKTRREAASLFQVLPQISRVM